MWFVVRGSCAAGAPGAWLEILSRSNAARPAICASRLRCTTHEPRPTTHEPRRTTDEPPRATQLIILFNKPYGVVCQFSPHASRPTLKDFIPIPAVYPAGRLDWDSEGLVVLTDEGKTQHCIADPRQKMEKTYWVQVEGIPTDVALEQLTAGIKLDGALTLPARAVRIEQPPGLCPRQPAVRFRKLIPTAWLEIRLTEGRNRQVRRMTAATGFPTLRLVRWRVGPWTLAGLAPGAHRQGYDSDLSGHLPSRVNRV